MRKIRHRFRERIYTVLFKKPYKCFGDTKTPKEGRMVVVPPDKTTYKIFLCTLIHEAIHACAWDLDEEAVAEISTDTAMFLWRCGFRFDKTAFLKEKPIETDF